MLTITCIIINSSMNTFHNIVNSLRQNRLGIFLRYIIINSWYVICGLYIAWRAMIKWAWPAGGGVSSTSMPFIIEQQGDGAAHWPCGVLPHTGWEINNINNHCHIVYVLIMQTLLSETRQANTLHSNKSNVLYCSCARLGVTWFQSGLRLYD